MKYKIRKSEKYFILEIKGLEECRSIYKDGVLDYLDKLKKMGKRGIKEPRGKVEF